MLFDALFAFGAELTSFTIKMEPQKIFNLEFLDYGIPPHAQILDVGFTPNSSSDEFILPTLFTGNRIATKIPSDKISLYPAVLGAKSWGVPTNIQVYVIWFDKSEDVNYPLF